MKHHKFKNETFEFSIGFISFGSSDKNSYKAANKLLKKLGYDKQERKDSLIGNLGFTCDAGGVVYIFMDEHEYKKLPKKQRFEEMLVTLAHECNHVRERVLNSIREKEGMRETESSMRISDWCFRKCLSVPFFKKMMK